jgi:hypothetical protein
MLDPKTSGLPIESPVDRSLHPRSVASGDCDFAGDLLYFPAFLLSTNFCEGLNALSFR